MTELKQGKPISTQVSDYLIGFTSSRDIADVSAETGVGVATLNYVKRRVNNISKDNENAVKALLKRAYDNADKKIKEANKCKREIKKILKSECG